MALIPADAWRPRGIADLEPNAWKALRRQGSTCVIAGPGAGKSEFLAQRVSYLLETGTCAPPYRVLAISFKTDAAENLASRVRQRCAPEQSNRFVSLTFDAFTKSLVDRFMSALPETWRPRIPYEVSFTNRRQLDNFLERTRVGAPKPWQGEIAGLGPSTFEPRVVGTFRLPLQLVAPSNGTEFAVQRWWHENLRQGERSGLTFVMLNRLAELVLRSNPQIARALRATYPFVFIDEFQDTTFAQYDFLQSAFAYPRIAVTAVGDNKQRIMTWAGARTDSFTRFSNDFAAEQIPLLFNFRSSADLVRIQHIVARALDSGIIPTVAQVNRKVDGDVAQVWKCSTEEKEADQIANWIALDMAQRNTSARDYALLVRQTADKFEEQLQGSLANVGLSVRNESRALGRTTLQDLLAEELTTISIALLRLGVQRRAPEAWRTSSVAIQQLHGADADDDIACDRAERALTTFISQLRAKMRATPPDVATAQALVDYLVAFLDTSALARTHTRYSTGDTLGIAIEAFQLHLSACAFAAKDWKECLDRFEGIGQVPLMTVHKSKGLEYDTVIFVGLDDKMWWSHSAGNPEGVATFFVALSRAKQRAIFTFCRARGLRERVADLYQLLTDAGVPEVSIYNLPNTRKYPH